MTVLGYLDAWRASGRISAEEYATLAPVVRKERFSVFLELQALLYLGVVFFVAGLGWTVREHFASLGDAAIVVPLALAFAGCLYYCFSRAQPYTHGQVESPTFGFDYVLYLGCLVLAVELGYIEFRFELLQANWDFYLLMSAVLYFTLAYRFDNRFVLSLALSTLAGFFGVRLSWLGFGPGTLRVNGLAYAALVAATGSWTRRAGVKTHFLDTYLHVASNVALAALVSGVASGEPRWLWIAGLILACAFVIERGMRTLRFAYVVYGTAYGYVGLSIRIVDAIGDFGFALLYFVVSSLAVIISLVAVSHRLGREE
jgi:Predicted membrane protein (DUF2157)